MPHEDSADHYEPAVMTYAARVYDLDGNFADCLAFGHDPVGLTNGDYDATCVNCPAAPSELASCVAAVSAQ